MRNATAETSSRSDNDHAARTTRAADQELEIMSRAPRIYVLVILSAVFGAASAATAQRESGCDCDEGASSDARSSRGSRQSSDGCPSPKLLYESPRAPWYVVTDAVAFKRDSSDERDFAALNTPGNVVLSTDDLHFEFQGGLRAMVGRQISDWYAIEGSYFGLMTWDESHAVRDVTLNGQGTLGNLFSPFSNLGVNPGLVGFDFNTFASIRVVSSVDNAELNLRQRLDTPPSMMQASVLYGLRYMHIRERFEYRTQSLSPTPVGTSNAIDVETGNDLLGFQLGGMLEFRVEPRCWISVEGKGAICNNGADQQTRFTPGTLATPAAPVTGRRDSDRTAFIGDVAVTLAFEFTPTIVGRVGYQAIWVDGVALASENLQANASLLSLGPAELVDDGGLVYHGPFAGIMWTW
jgi:hypothetical protein